MHGAAARRIGGQSGVLRRLALRGLPLLDRPADRQVAVDQVVGRGLVGHQIGLEATGTGPAHQFGQHLGGIAQQGDGNRFFFSRVLLDQFNGVVDVARLLVHVPGAQPEVDAGLLALDVQRDRPRQRGGQGLRTAHAAKAGGQDPLARKVIAVMLASGFDKGFEGALHNTLAADVDPAAGGHLAVHEQALAVELVEVLPVGPFGHQIGVGNEHAGRVGVGLEHAHRLARLHQQGLIVVQVLQRGQDLVETCPVARRAADAAVHHQGLWVLGDFGVQVVLDHAVGRLGDPALAMQLAASGRADDTGGVDTGIVVGAHGRLLYSNAMRRGDGLRQRRAGPRRPAPPAARRCAPCRWRPAGRAACGGRRPAWAPGRAAGSRPAAAQRWS